MLVASGAGPVVGQFGAGTAHELRVIATSRFFVVLVLLFGRKTFLLVLSGCVVCPAVGRFGAVPAALLGRGPAPGRCGGSSGVELPQGGFSSHHRCVQPALALLWLLAMARLGTALSCFPVGLLVAAGPSLKALWLASALFDV